MPNPPGSAADSMPEGGANGHLPIQVHPDLNQAGGRVLPVRADSSPTPTYEEALESLGTSSRKKCEGGAFPKHVVALNFASHDFINISAKDVIFEGCNFQFCVFNGAYFRKAQFKNCDFTGAKFKDCNFRDCILSGSKFNYAQFSNTLISTKELLLNSPSWLNVRREFMMSLRKNSESVGDVESAKIFIREELKAARKYCQEGWRHQGAYYKEKYPKISNRAVLFGQSVGYGLDWWFWGHGEYPAKLGRFILVALLISGAITLAFDNRVSVDMTPVSAFLRTYGLSTVSATCTFLGVSADGGLPAVPEPLRIALVLFRYVALGFFTSSLFRRLSRR
ncbi:pentapeptide repeat-containing protein [Burkholderia cepacia]|uniref:pentapeptide repeat-containing protein n=1 Tax=Burkholderia cepacia TaxID=292 RepID=UPI002654BFA9|nr:pentapeptide repeat-containing protein [Burkholderia cepacia]MDN7892971.1 pentapeptide repeat-containing protein [Burkholderia cepacia]